MRARMTREELAAHVATKIRQDLQRSYERGGKPPSVAFHAVDARMIDEELHDIEEKSPNSIVAAAVRRLNPDTMSVATWRRFVRMVRNELQEQIRGLP